MSKQAAFIENLVYDLFGSDEKKKAIASKGLEIAEKTIPEAYDEVMNSISSKIAEIA